MTLVELLVSMGIFAVVMTITVGFFIVMQKMQMMYRDRANLQQEGRIAVEVFSRIVREAKSVTINSSPSGSGEICFTGAGGGVTIIMPDGTNIWFICSSNSSPRTLRITSCTPVPPSTGCSLNSANSTEISSSQINMKSFIITRGTDSTYPKTLRYRMEVEKPNPQGEGDKIIFPGYLVMKNEL